MTELFPEIPEMPNLPGLPPAEPLPDLKNGLVIGPEDGEAVWLLDELVTFKIGVVETDYALSVSEVAARPGGGPPLHVHYLQEEAFYLLEGTLTLKAGKQSRRIVAGSFVAIPSKVPHTYRVEGKIPAKLLVIYTPAGYENFFREIGEAARVKVLPPKDHLPDIQRYVQGQVKYNSEILGPPLGPG